MRIPPFIAGRALGAGGAIHPAGCVASCVLLALHDLTCNVEERVWLGLPAVDDAEAVLQVRRQFSDENILHFSGRHLILHCVVFFFEVCCKGGDGLR